MKMSPRVVLLHPILAYFQLKAGYCLVYLVNCVGCNGCGSNTCTTMAPKGNWNHRLKPALALEFEPHPNPPGKERFFSFEGPVMNVGWAHRAARCLRRMQAVRGHAGENGQALGLLKQMPSSDPLPYVVNNMAGPLLDPWCRRCRQCKGDTQQGAPQTLTTPHTVDGQNPLRTTFRTWEPTVC